MKKIIPSKRRYLFSVIESDECTLIKCYLDDLINSDDEWAYSVLEHLDDLLDLQISGRLMVSFRDTEENFVAIKRIE